ncbi:RNase adapter RapZ [Endozoicomonadaceae bacterium StTr2]
MATANASQPISLVIISGRSGSGKSAALNALEDQGYYCIDNLPANLLSQLAGNIHAEGKQKAAHVAVSIDTRNAVKDLGDVPGLLDKLRERKSTVMVQVVYLDSDPVSLIKRFNLSRRRHPLSEEMGLSLEEAIHEEARVLEPLMSVADLKLDTTNLSVHELREMIRLRVVGHDGRNLSLLFQSFGFKHGVPLDADYIFDVRCLPNPYWVEALREYTGLEKPVIDYLSQQPEVDEMLDNISQFISRWLPDFEKGGRSYVTVAIGCTGGQHRSVYIANKLAEHFNDPQHPVRVSHRQLGVTESL